MFSIINELESIDYPDCKVVIDNSDKVTNYPDDAIKINRKLQLLNYYLSSISSLLSASTDTEIKTAYAEAVTQLSALSNNTDSNKLSNVSSFLTDNSDILNSGVSSLEKHNRYHKFKKY